MKNLAVSNVNSIVREMWGLGIDEISNVILPAYKKVLASKVEEIRSQESQFRKEVADLMEKGHVLAEKRVALLNMMSSSEIEFSLGSLSLCRKSVKALNEIIKKAEIIKFYGDGFAIGTDLMYNVTYEVQLEDLEVFPVGFQIMKSSGIEFSSDYTIYFYESYFEVFQNSSRITTIKYLSTNHPYTLKGATPNSLEGFETTFDGGVLDEESIKMLREKTRYLRYIEQQQGKGLIYVHAIDGQIKLVCERLDKFYEVIVGDTQESFYYKTGLSPQHIARADYKVSLHTLDNKHILCLHRQDLDLTIKSFLIEPLENT